MKQPRRRAARLRMLGCRWRQPATRRQPLATSLQVVASVPKQVSHQWAAGSSSGPQTASRPPKFRSPTRSQQQQPDRKRESDEPIIRVAGRGAGGCCLGLLCLALSCLTNQVKLPSNVECSMATPAPTLDTTLLGASYLASGFVQQESGQSSKKVASPITRNHVAPMIGPPSGLLAEPASVLDFPLVLMTNKDNRTFAKRQQPNQLDAHEITETFAVAETGSFLQLPVALAQPESQGQAQEVSPQLQLGSDKQTLTEPSALLIVTESAAREAQEHANRIHMDLCRNFSIGTQHENGGAFTSPSYPSPYPTNIVCTKVIEAPPGHYIVLEFRDDFSIEEAGLDCDNDKIEIRDGRYGYSKVLARFCGSRFPPEVSSSDQSMWLRFVSDASIAHKGFRAVYKFEKQKIIKPNPPYECRFNVTSLVSSLPILNGTDNRTGIHSGLIRNADIPDKLIEYTKNYNASLECIWNITVRPGWKIYLTFLIYELSKPNDCDSNFIEIYEENLTEENQTVKFCGTRTEPQQSKSNVFNIRHHASSNANGSKFEIIYTAFRDKGPEGCESREFDCDDGTCIHDSLKCDGQYNCKYHYDENSEPGPCQGFVEGTFFETEHMVIILIVFLTLVGGMCASIVVSCWGKIQERRRRKLEYHLRKSRETSMSGQLNNVDQMIYGSTNGPTNSGSKQGLTASIRPSENFAQQQTASSKYGSDSDGDAGNGTRRFPASDNLLQQQQTNYLPPNHYGTHPKLMSHVLTSASHNYGITAANQSMASNSSMGMKLGDVHGFESDEFMNLKDNSRLNYINASQQQFKSVDGSSVDLQHSIPANLSSKQMSHYLANQSANKQQSVPDISINNQLKSMMSMQSSNNHHQIAANEQAKQSAIQKQQMLNLSIARNQPLPQQNQPNQFFGSIYRPYQLDNTNINNSNNNNTTNSNGTSIETGNSGTLHDYGGPLRLQQNAAGVDNYPREIFARPTNQTMSSNPIKYNIITANGSQHHSQRTQAQIDSSGQSINYNTLPGSQLSGNVSLEPQRTSTVSNTVNQSIYRNPLQRPQNLQAIYEFYPHAGQPLNANNLSSSITCCNLAGSCPNETPLLDNLIATSNMQQHHDFHYPQNARIYELRSATIDARKFNAAIPRSISAHQLSKLHIQQPLASKQPKQAKKPLQQLQFQPQQHQLHQLPYKSVSDAGKVATRHHQPPDHSLSYPHACTGPHDNPVKQLRDESPALPPPPPPPNLVHQTARPEVIGGNVVAPALSQIDNRRSVFKVSRLDSSHLANDNMQDRETVMNSLLLGSMQFDEQSTESDGTFGMMISQPSAIGKPVILNVSTPMNCAVLDNQTAWQQQGPFVSHGPRNNFPQKHIQSAVNHHLSGCNLILQLRQQQLGQPFDQNLSCNCGVNRVNQIYQRHLTNSSREFDDSDDGLCLVQQAEVGAFEGAIGNHHAQFNSNPSHSSVNRQKQKRSTCFKQRSSEVTADEEDDENEDDDEDQYDAYQLDQEDDESSDLGVRRMKQPNDGGIPVEYRARSVVCNEELLRDEPTRNFTGSHTSISCQSCTCGSQLRLNRLNTDEDMEQQHAQPTSASSTHEKHTLARAVKNEKSLSENQQATNYLGASKNYHNKNNTQQSETRTPKKTQESFDSRQSKLTGSKENCDTTKATVGNNMS